MSEIKIMCEGSHFVDLNEMEPFQDFDDETMLKELDESGYEKIKNSLLSYGFRFPFKTWKDESDGTIYTLDGHQRAKVLKRMRDVEGIDIPAEFPAVRVEAETKQEVAELILLDNSRYGKITEDGLYAFMNVYDIKDAATFEDLQQIVDIPDFDFEGFWSGAFGDSVSDREHNPENMWDGMPEFEQNDNMPYRTLYIHFNDEVEITDFAKKNNFQITDKTKTVWFNEPNRIKPKDYKYVSKKQS